MWEGDERGWRLRRTAVLLAATAGSLQLAAFVLIASAPPLQSWPLALIPVEFGAWAVWALRRAQFRRVFVHFALSFGGLVALALFKRSSLGPAAGWVLAAVAATIAAGAVQLTERRFARFLDHNDVAHILVGFAALAFLNAGLQLTPGA